MARPKEKLDDKQLQSWVRQAKAGTITKRFMKGDGGGLWFSLAPPNGASWLFRYSFGGKEKFIGYGVNAKGYPAVSLKMARDWAEEQRRLLAQGIDPMQAREPETVKTFRDCARDYIRTHSDGWRNPAHAAQWPSTMEAYVYPVMGDVPVSDVTKAHVLAVLEQPTEKNGKRDQLWKLKNDTARKVQQRMKLVLDWAKAWDYRTGDNPAEWAQIKHRLSKPSNLKEHHTHLPHPQIGAFMAELRKRQAISALALEFLILTASRTTEVRCATWSEFDLEAKVWTVPAKRMKAAKEHLVPLTDAAMAVLEKMMVTGRKPDPAAYVFPGEVKGKPLSNMAMATLLQKRMGVANDKGELVTVHGFRGSFSTWARETTNYPRDLVELALAHTTKDKAEAAYQHSAMVERRRQLMEAWARLCSGPAESNVKPLLTEIAAYLPARLNTLAGDQPAST